MEWYNVLWEVIQKYMKQFWQQQLHRLVYISSSFIRNSTQILKAESKSSTDFLFLDKQIAMSNTEYNL